MTSIDATCQHENTTPETVEPTCEETGSTTYYCDSCGAQVGDTITLDALGHNYENGYCTNEDCGKQDPATISYEGYYYIAFKRSAGNYFYVGNGWDARNERYVATDSEVTELPALITEMDMKYVFRFVKNTDGTYNIYEANDGELFAGEVANVTIIDNEDGTFSITNSEGVYFSFNNSTGSNYVKWYDKSVQVRALSLVPVDLTANIGSANATVEADITMNYYVTLSDSLVENTVMQFVVGNDMYEIAPTQDGDRYVFSLPNLPPHFMTENIKASLVCNGITMDTEENYSVKIYVQNLLTANQGNDELVNFLTAMLQYGDAAQAHQNHNMENLATTGVTGMATLGTPTIGEEDKMSIETHAETCGAWFEGANVWFSSVNKICVRINTTENVTLTINGVEVAVTNTTIYTDGIAATAFGDKVEFKLYYDGELMQTLNYSIYSYAYAKQNTSNTLVKNLVLAMYNYGKAAEAFNA